MGNESDKLKEAYGHFLEKNCGANSGRDNYFDIGVLVDYIVSSRREGITFEEILKALPENDFIDETFLFHEIGLRVEDGKLERKSGSYFAVPFVRNLCDSYVMSLYPFWDVK